MSQLRRDFEIHRFDAYHSRKLRASILRSGYGAVGTAQPLDWEHSSPSSSYLDEVLDALQDIVSQQREGEITIQKADNDTFQGPEDRTSEEKALFKEVDACITRLFRVSRLVRQAAAPSNLFDEALSRNSHLFNDQFDVAHVGERFPKLATEENQWLQTRLGRAISQRRLFLSYIQEYRGRTER